MKKNKQVNVQILQAADYVGEVLCRHGCTVHRYDAVSSSSVYLKVDAGVACTIRLSDHEGKSNLSYRFNYMAHVPGTEVEYINDGADRYYYQAGALDTMVRDILMLRGDRSLMYKSYDNLVQEKLMSAESWSGFWKNAYQLTFEESKAA